ncbi:DUF998 domain-containing protein [Anaerocolumna xylanovorans]|uniref:DUF998 domain-containing protein n=1 Tax=Anaerocolumna xylanovorans DSM 12503 TaxID=1121345 RepID=A0A1M7Y0F2_9FIRM|nr:DUF998 domain-containing protein [Anaerocolumna xylanovorans]SHO45087.1 Protein of unknown function [Anaerocolumna xylanovorans DSM 12503]
MKCIRWFMPLGMASAVFYFIHVFLGQVLWKEYNPITTDISSLTADGAPNAGLLRIFTAIYGICFLLFALGMVVKAFAEYHGVTRIGYSMFFIMALTSVIGYSLFPLTGDKTVMNFQNMMHIVVTVIVVFTTILSFFLIAIGYLHQEKLKTLGRICLVIAVLIMVFGATNPIGMAMKLNILGLSERLVIFTLQLFVCFLSFIYTYNTELVLKKNS